MKLLISLGLLLATLLSASAARMSQTPTKAKPKAPVAHGPRRPASRSDVKQQSKSSRRGKENVRRVVVRRMVHGRWVTVSRVVRVKRGPVVPPHPDPERLREIQQALADKGYFKGEVNGVWDADSVASMKQFQTDQKLPPDGKINALSLTGLGLGPKHDSSIAVLPSEKAEQNIPQQNIPQ